MTRVIEALEMTIDTKYGCFEGLWHRDLTLQAAFFFNPPRLDTQIASIAIANNLILITKNTKDFSLFQDDFGLMVEEW